MKQYLVVILLISLLSCDNKQRVSTHSQEDEVAKTTTIACVTMDAGSQAAIDSVFAKRIEPKIRRWLTYFELDIYNFLVEGTSDVPHWDNDEGTIYYRAFEKTDDVYKPQLFDYSPNKNIYTTALYSAGVHEEGGLLYYNGGDDCQEIYMVNRLLRKKALILWLGTGTFVEDCFWIDNNTIVFVGSLYAEESLGMWVYNLETNLSMNYRYRNDEQLGNMFRKSYFEDVSLKSRGIIHQ